MSLPEFHIIIPARYNSSRFPEKLLSLLEGISILERTYKQALAAKPLSITIAVDDKALFEHAKAFGASVIMTAVEHVSGTDRLAEAAKILGLEKDEIIINVQGDEPFMPSFLIQELAAVLYEAQNCEIATVCTQITDLSLINDPNTVKVVFNKQREALYFSRSVIPRARDLNISSKIYKHIGLYAYRAKFLQNLQGLLPCELENTESLEQLRFLWEGYKIKLALTEVKPFQDINTLEDLEKAKNFLQNGSR